MYAWLVAPNCGSGVGVIAVGEVGNKGVLPLVGEEGVGDDKGVEENEDATEEEENDGDIDQSVDAGREPGLLLEP